MDVMQNLHGKYSKYHLSVKKSYWNFSLSCSLIIIFFVLRQVISDGVSRLGLGLVGLVSVSKDLGLELLVSRLCIGYFL